MKDIGIIGAGYTGLAAAWELLSRGHKVTLYEQDATPGGLAGSFTLENGATLEKFYHHWFNSDEAIFELIKEMGLESKLCFTPSNNGLFYANSIFRLSSPLDLLRFSPLPFIDRVRTGLMALYARQIKDWKPLEAITAEEWIRQVGGEKAFNLIWQPLLKGKFGSEAPHVSAVWFWNKLKLRGGSRSSDGLEQLAYYSGGFGALTDDMSKAVVEKGATLRLSCPVDQLIVAEGRCTGVTTDDGDHPHDAVLATVPLPVFLGLSDAFPPAYLERHQQIRFLGNTCLILTLNRSLSDTYWLNVADPEFPFVGIIEHTNFDSCKHYGGKHIAYLSKYLPTSDPLFSMNKEEFFAYCTPFIQRIFPDFAPDWVDALDLWKAHYSQPVVSLHYSSLIPPVQGPFDNLWLSTMAQVYPEDRGTNYAVQHGRKVARELHSTLTR